jgi:hypothetical protein
VVRSYDSIEAITLTEKNEILIAGFTGSSDFPQVNLVTNQKNNDGGCFLASFQIDGTPSMVKKSEHSRFIQYLSIDDF